MGRASRYIPVRAIKVSLWNRTVGAIVPYSAGYCAFEYDSAFLKSGLEIAPIKMPLANGAGPYVFNDFGPGVFMGLPGVFADSLPDGFGNTLINEYLRRQGIGAESIMTGLRTSGRAEWARSAMSLSAIRTAASRWR